MLPWKAIAQAASRARPRLSAQPTYATKVFQASDPLQLHSAVPLFSLLLPYLSPTNSLSSRAASSKAMDPYKSETHQPWETEPEGALKGLVLEDKEVFRPVRTVEGNLRKLVPYAPEHTNYCLSRLRFHPNAEKQINNMINVEYSMSLEFHAMGNYFGRDCVALPGLSALFMHRSNETRDNAIKLANYVSRRGGCAVLKDIAAPVGEYGHQEKGDALHGMELTLAMEKAETDKFMALNKVAEDLVDEQLSDYLTDTFMDRQVELVRLHATYVSQLRRVGSGHGHWNWDNELLKKLSAPPIPN